IDRSNGATLENVTVDASANGLWNSNYSAKTITIKNCNFSSVDTWQRNDTTKTTYVFQGNNTVNAFGINSSLDTLKLGDADATLTAPEGLNVTTDVAGKDVFYKDGVYFVVNNLEGSGTEADPFKIANIDDLIKFRNSVNKGETKYNAEGVYVELVADIDLASIENWEPIGTFDYSFDGNFDGNGHKIMNLKMSDSTAANGEAYLGFFGVTANNTIENFVIENVTIKSNGQIVAAAIAYPYYTTVNNITVCGDIAIEGGNYTAGVLAYTRLCENASNLTVSGNEGSYITGAQVVGGVIADLQMNNGLVADYSDFSVSGVTITGTKNVGGICGIIGVQTLNGATVQNVALVSNDSRVGTVAGSVGTVATISDVVVENVTGATAVIGGAYTNGAAVEAKTGDVYYTTFAAAAKAANGETIVLLAPVVITKDTTLSDLTVDGNGVYPAFRVANGATLTVENCNIYNATDYVFTLGASDKTTAGNVVIKSGSYKGQTTVASVTMGTLTINGGEFSVFDSEYGATYLLNCYDANYKNGSAQIVVNGGSFVGFNPANNAAEGAGTSFVADGKCVKDVNGTFFVGNHVVTKVYTEATKEADAFTTYDCEHCGYHEVVTHEGTKVLPVAKIGNVEYYSLQEAVDAADPSNTNVTITLLRDAEGAGVVIPEGKFS
ncbi:MAG: hypothetical protein IKY17_08045, partial [Oscillospiraceae bacterium]|nr:hypothetical protein [Oscillospiraceae bacterium]